MDISYIEGTDDYDNTTCDAIPRHTSAAASPYRSIPTSDLGGIFIPAEIYTSQVKGTNAAEYFATELYNSMAWERGINIRFMTQLLQLKARKPYYFAGGKTKKGWTRHDQNVNTIHTGTQVVNVKTILTLIPPISRHGTKPLFYGNQLIIPYETVDRDAFARDINEFITLQNVIAALTGSRRLSSVVRGKMMKSLIPRLLNPSNSIWNRIHESVRQSAHCTTDDEVNAMAQEIVETHWWPDMMPNKHNNLGHRVSHMANYAMDIWMGVTILTKLKDMDVSSIVDEMKRITDRLHAQNAPENIATILSNDANGIIQKLIDVLEIIEGMKAYLISFEPIPCGIIAVAQTHFVSPGDSVELSLM
jgi:hypothetical protein